MKSPKQIIMLQPDSVNIKIAKRDIKKIKKTFFEIAISKRSVIIKTGD